MAEETTTQTTTETDSVVEIESTEQQIANQMAARIKKGKQILDASEKQIIEAIKVDGKTLKQWSSHLLVKLPEEDTDIKQLEVVQSKIGNSIQRAESVLARFEMQSNVASSFHDEGFARRYVEEMEAPIEGPKKRIAAEKIRQKVLVDTTVDSSLAATQAAKVIVEYFKRIVKGLEEARKSMENRIRLIGLRMRFLNDHS